MNGILRETTGKTYITFLNYRQEIKFYTWRG